MRLICKFGVYIERFGIGPCSFKNSRITLTMSNITNLQPSSASVVAKSSGKQTQGAGTPRSCRPRCPRMSRSLFCNDHWIRSRTIFHMHNTLFSLDLTCFRTRFGQNWYARRHFGDMMSLWDRSVFQLMTSGSWSLHSYVSIVFFHKALQVSPNAYVCSMWECDCSIIRKIDQMSRGSIYAWQEQSVPT